MANKIKYGLRNVKYSKITDTTGTHTYGTVNSLVGAVTLNIAPAGDQTDFYADDSLYFSLAVNQGYTGDLTIANIPEEFYTNILGFTKNSDGVLIENADAMPSQFALGFEVQGDSDASRFWFYNCSVARPGQDNQTKETGITPATDTLTITMAPRPSDKVVRAKITETDDNKAVYDAFFTNVYEETVSA